MKIVGLTGGIGSGKTTVAKAFHAYGIPLYISDVEAKKLMVESQEIKNLLTQLFGPDTYLNGELNRPFIADKIFNDDTLLHQMNAIIHPRVAQHFKDWVNRQDAPYVIKESAILFESKANIGCDIIITVTLDKATRIKRLLKRDKTTVEKIEAIMKKQWPDVKRIALSDYVIVNDTLEHMKLQVAKIHKTILNKIG
ncbi:dephospho-CoA kinase [Formosa sp. S-31]|uniref:dephospho-CoA kinase n=1 Tax=Formosa sp. S-31 TaxID=2790949 RepID=UPI003EBEDE28